MTRWRMPWAFVPLFCFWSLTGLLQGGAIAQADFRFTMQFPAATVNQFGYSGPLLSAPAPVTDWDGDGVIHKAEPSTLLKLQVDPLKIRVEGGPLDVETTNEGDASAEVDGDIFGRLENLTSVPLTVTLNFAVNSKLYTHVDCDECDYARSEIFATFQVGDWSDFYDAISTLDGPPFDLGFTGGDVTVTIPASSVIPYLVSWTVEAEASSFCPSTCDDPPAGTPEPGTLLLFGGGLAGLFWKRTSIDKLRKLAPIKA